MRFPKPNPQGISEPGREVLLAASRFVNDMYVFEGADCSVKGPLRHYALMDAVRLVNAVGEMWAVDPYEPPWMGEFNFPRGDFSVDTAIMVLEDAMAAYHGQGYYPVLDTLAACLTGEFSQDEVDGAFS